MKTTTSANAFTKRLAALAGLSLIGTGLSAYQSTLFYNIRSGSAGFKSFCNIGATMNCDAVMASPYAEFIAGIPLSSFAAGWFLATFVVALLLRDAEWRREGGRKVALWMTGFAAVVSLVYLVIMSSVLNTFCLFCLITDALTFTSFGIVLSMSKEESGSAPLMPRLKTVGGIVAGCLFVVIVLLKSTDKMNVSRSEINDMVQSVMNSRVYSVNTGEDLTSMGPKDAPVTIVKFSDFQCPYCRLGAVMVNTLLNRYPQQVRVVFRNFPIDPACNPSVQRAVHPHACEAAKVAYCANQQGKFKPVYEQIFENQATLAKGSAQEYAKQVGLDMTALQSCVDSSETQAAIARDIQEANNLGVTSTPTFYINGRKMEGMAPIDAWDQLIEKLGPTAR